MAKEMRMSSAARKLNIALDTVAEALGIEAISTAKITQEQFEILKEKFAVPEKDETILIKKDTEEEKENVTIERVTKEEKVIDNIDSQSIHKIEKLPGLEVLGNLAPPTTEEEKVEDDNIITEVPTEETPTEEAPTENEPEAPLTEVIEAKAVVKGITLLGKMNEEDLQKKQPIASSDAPQEKKKKT